MEDNRDGEVVRVGMACEPGPATQARGHAVVAVVVSSSNLPPHPQVYTTTYDAIAHVFATDSRYVGCRVERVGWDSDITTDWSRFSHIVMSDELVYVNYAPRFLHWINNLPPDARTKLLNPLCVIKWNINKRYLLQLKSKGVRVPRTVFVYRDDSRQTPELSNVLSQLKPLYRQEITQIVIKNIVDADGTSTMLTDVSDYHQARAAYEDAMKQSQTGLIVQEYLPAIKSEGEWSLIYFNGQLSHGVLKTAKSGEFRVQTRWGGGEQPMSHRDIPQHLREFGASVMDAVAGVLYSERKVDEIRGTEQTGRFKSTVQAPRRGKEERKKVQAQGRERLLYARVDTVHDQQGLPCLMEFEAFEPSLYFFTHEVKVNFVDALLS